MREFGQYDDDTRPDDKTSSVPQRFTIDELNSRTVVVFPVQLGEPQFLTDAEGRNVLRIQVGKRLSGRAVVLTGLFYTMTSMVEASCKYF